MLSIMRMMLHGLDDAARARKLAEQINWLLYKARVLKFAVAVAREQTSVKFESVARSLRPGILAICCGRRSLPIHRGLASSIVASVVIHLHNAASTCCRCF